MAVDASFSADGLQMLLKLVGSRECKNLSNIIYHLSSSSKKIDIIDKKQARKRNFQPTQAETRLTSKLGGCLSSQGFIKHPMYGNKADIDCDRNCTSQHFYNLGLNGTTIKTTKRYRRKIVCCSFQWQC
jgi:hypothetical protein